MKEEVWKPIPGFEASYHVSNHGRILALERQTTQIGRCGKLYKRIKRSKILKHKFCKSNGYFMVTLSVNNIQKTMTIHRAIALAFLDNPGKLREINHINGIKTDNRIENLEWCSSSYNRIHAFKNGLQEKTMESYKLRVGEKSPIHKLTDSKVIEILKLYKTIKSQRILAKMFHVSKSTITSIVNGHTWKHINRV